MPKIEKPNQRQVLPDVTDQPELGGVPSDGLGNLVQSLASTTQEAVQTYTQLQVQEAEAEAREATNNLQKGLNDTLYDPTTGYFNKKGKAAYQSAEEARQQIEQMREQYGSELSDMARERFNQQTAQVVQSTQRDISLQAAQGLEEWNSQEYETFTQGLISDAAKFSGKPQHMGRVIEKAQQEVIEWGRSRGWSREKILSHADNLTSSVLTNAINGALARGEVDQAQELYENNKDNLVSQDYLKATQAVNQAQEREREKNQASRVAGAAQTIRSQTGSYREALEMASRYGADAEEVEQIRDQLDESFRRDENARDYAAAQAKRTLSQVVANNPEITTAELIDQHPNAWSNLTPDQKASFKGDLQFGEKLENYFKFKKMSPEQAAKVKYSWIANNVPADKQDEALDRVSEARRGQLPGQGAPEDTGGVSPDIADSVDRLVTQMYGTPEDRTEEEESKAQMAYRIGDQMARDLAQDGQLTPEDTAKIMDSIAMKTKEQDAPWYDVFGSGEVGLQDVPAEKQREAMQYLRENDIPISGENVLAYTEEGPDSETLEAAQQVSRRRDQAAEILGQAGIEVTEDRVQFFVEDKMSSKMYDNIAAWLRDRGREATRSNIYSAYYQTFR